MTNFVQPATALPAQQMAMQGMPTYGMQQAMPMPGAHGQPVYVTSMSQVPPGAIPVSQGMLAQALGQSQLGAQAVQQPTSSASPIKSMLKFAAIGAVAGAGFGIIPFLPLGLFSGAVVGAGVGAAIGLVKGLRDKKAEAAAMGSAQEEEMQRQHAVAGQAMTAPGAVPPAGPATTQAGVVMSSAMRTKWAAKVAAERAAAAKAA